MITSADGTRIAYTRAGSGPPLILVDGAMCFRASGPAQPLAAQLTDRFTVYTYDRRGRGESTDTAPYTTDRELEDLEALVKEAGGNAYLYGISSGAVLALDAANRGLGITRLAVYEAPLVVDDSRPPAPADFLDQFNRLIAAGQRAKAVHLFMATGVRVPTPVVYLMRLMPAWRTLKAVAHTLPYDMAFMDGLQQGNPLPADRWSAIDVPTLIMDGGKSPTWMRNGTKALAQVVPNARYRTIEGQTHMLKPEAIAPILKDFFGS
jgi:pimeloyl-ACP methyl ester carboxylesterase